MTALNLVFSERTLIAHVLNEHSSGSLAAQSTDVVAVRSRRRAVQASVVCPMCAVKPGGDMTVRGRLRRTNLLAASLTTRRRSQYYTPSFVHHVNNRHVDGRYNAPVPVDSVRRCDVFVCLWFLIFCASDADGQVPKRAEWRRGRDGLAAGASANGRSSSTADALTRCAARSDESTQSNADRQRR